MGNGGAYTWTPTVKPSESMTQSSRLEDDPQWVLTDGLGIGDRYERSRYALLKVFSGPLPGFCRTPLPEPGCHTRIREQARDARPSASCSPEPKLDRSMPPFVFCETWDKWELEIQEMHWLSKSGECLDADAHRPVRGMFNGLLASHRIPRCGYSAATRNCVVLHRTFSSSLTRPRRALSRQSDRASSRFLFKPGDFVTPAWFLVQRWINEKLRGNSGPQLRYQRRAGY